MTDFTYLCTRNVCVFRGENMSLLQKLLVQVVVQRGTEVK